MGAVRPKVLVRIAASVLSAPQWSDLDYGDASGLSSHHASFQSYSSYY